jgi:hypothetical protein
MFKVAILCVLGDNIIYSYMTIFDSGKDAWGTLGEKFWVSNIVKELYQFKCVL